MVCFYAFCCDYTFCFSICLISTELGSKPILFLFDGNRSKKTIYSQPIRLLHSRADVSGRCRVSSDHVCTVTGYHTVPGRTLSNAANSHCRVPLTTDYYTVACYTLPSLVTHSHNCLLQLVAGRTVHHRALLPTDYHTFACRTLLYTHIIADNK